MQRFFVLISWMAVLLLLLGQPLRAQPVAGQSPDLLLDPLALSSAAGLDDADAQWVAANVPLLDCPDSEIQTTYYFRWHVYRRHIKRTPAGFVVTEFLPDVPWAGKYNTICCAAGHHIYEGRWIRDRKYMDDECRFWFTQGEPRRYSFWAADAVLAYCLASGDHHFAVSLLDQLIANDKGWQQDHQDPSGLFWQTDNRDGMEFSIGGSGCRPTINSYQYGDARAIAVIAGWAGKRAVASEYTAKADRLRDLVQSLLWNKQDQFFETMPRGKQPQLAGVRELVGFVPWYFDLPGPGFEVAWKQLLDAQGFAAEYGPTTAEQRSPRFNFRADHDCLWNGPSWPFATTQTLVAMANLLDDYHQDVISAGDYFQLLHNYARSQRKGGHPWVAEDLDARSGKWIVDLPRSVDYNHSGFCDPVITGMVGLRPQKSPLLELKPLVPKAWDYFCLDGVPYHGHLLTIFYDRTGRRYQHGRGFQIWIDGKYRGGSGTVCPLQMTLPN